MANQDERSIRRELAAAYRLAALFGWDDHIATHMSARLSDDTYLINSYGLLFSEITASSLVRVDMDNNVLEPGAHRVNPAGTNIHGGLLRGRSDINSVMHLHTREGVAVSALEDGLLPGYKIRLPTPGVQEIQARTMGSTWVDPFAEQRFWPAMLRKAERECVGFDE